MLMNYNGNVKDNLCCGNEEYICHNTDKDTNDWQNLSIIKCCLLFLSFESHRLLDYTVKYDWGDP